MVGQMQQELIKKNTVNGKMRMCTIDTKEPGLILEGTKDGKFRFEKESDKSVVEIDPENLAAFSQIFGTQIFQRFRL